MRRLPNLLLLFAVIAFAGSCLAWVLMDQSVWPWDEAFYGDFTLQVWRAKVLGPAGWLDAMFHPLFGLMPPLIVWTGQFFVPLRHLTGDFESALLLLNVAASCGALTLIYFISRNITRDRVAALIGMLVCASSPLFVAMTLLYRVEAVQSLTVAVMMFAAWQAARLSTVSMTALLFIGVSLGLLAKASSITFVLPLLVYVGVIRIFVTAPAKGLTDRNVWLLPFGIVLFVSTVLWYLLNYSMMVQHFYAATFSEDIALNYGSASNLPTKLTYWIRALGVALSPFTAVPIAFVLLIGIALVSVGTQLRGKPWRALTAKIIEDGTLFVFCLIGTCIASLFAYSLQINEDTRFLLPLVPMVAVAIAWSVNSIHRYAVSAIVVIGLVANMAINHAYAHGYNPFEIKPLYVPLAERTGNDKRRLNEVVALTCDSNSVGRHSIIGVEYLSLNANSANFYAEKQAYRNGSKCSYTNLGYLQKDLGAALARIERGQTKFVVTVAPDLQPPADYTNRVSRAFAVHLAHDDRLALVNSIDREILIYRLR
jgi:4-amino-4-deoxy-L-arabinose transferase-like glycosyltransferase